MRSVILYKQKKFCLNWSVTWYEILQVCVVLRVEVRFTSRELDHFPELLDGEGSMLWPPASNQSHTTHPTLTQRVQHWFWDVCFLL